MLNRLHRSLFGLISFHVLEYFYYYLGAVASLAVLHVAQSELPGLTKDFADSLAGDSGSFFIQFFLIAIGIIIFRTLSRLLFFYPARIQQLNLRIDLISLIENAPVKNYKHYDDGKLFQILFSDFNRLRGFTGFALLQVANIAIAFSVFFPKIYAFDKDLLPAFIPLFVGMGIFVLLIYLALPLARRNASEYDKVQDFLMESYHARMTIQNYEKEKIFSKKFHDYCETELNTYFKQAMGRVFAIPVVALSMGVALIWGGHIIYQKQLGASSLIFFSGFLFLVLEPLVLLSWIGVVFSDTLVGWKRIKDFISDLEQPCDDVVELWGKELDERDWAKKIYILIGETGSGKTHLLDQWAYQLKTKKKRVAYVKDTPYLFNSTIRANLFLGMETTQENENEARELLDLFDLTHLTHNEDILDLEIGENGKEISGGQGKRLALARSLLLDAEYLLWDDPFSSVDYTLEKKIFEKLNEGQALSGKTIIMSSHRLTTFQHANLYYYLRKNNPKLEPQIVTTPIRKGTKEYEFFSEQIH